MANARNQHCANCIGTLLFLLLHSTFSFPPTLPCNFLSVFFPSVHWAGVMLGDVVSVSVSDECTLCGGEGGGVTWFLTR